MLDKTSNRSFLFIRYPASSIQHHFASPARIPPKRETGKQWDYDSHSRRGGIGLRRSFASIAPHVWVWWIHNNESASSIKHRWWFSPLLSQGEKVKIKDLTIFHLLSKDEPMLYEQGNCSEKFK
jgi:hypothetical protein